jgi:hypothetical protein
MLGFNRKGATLSCLSVVAACCFTVAVEAATINIILSNMDVSYAGGESGGVFFDSMGGTPGGNLNPALADTLSTAVFELDGNAVGTLTDATDDLYGDLRIINIGATITKNVFHPSLGVNGGGFGFDFFTQSGTLLRLGMTNVSAFVSNNVFFFTGEATILPGSQDLPFGLQFDESQPVVFSYTATLPAVQQGTTTNSAISSGAFTISGVAIPEPAAYMLLSVGFLAVSSLVFRRPPRAISAAVPSMRT